MSPKHPRLLISLFFILALLFASMPVTPANAEGDDFSVTVELTGVIQSISSTQLVFTNGTTVKINRGTKNIATGLKSGMSVIVVAEMDDDQFVAKSIQITASSAATSASASDDDKGKGKGKASGNRNGNGNNAQNGDNDHKGGKGKGQSKDNGKANKANDRDTGKSKADKAKAECLSRTNHPVAKQLAVSLGVSYTEIMKWHCEGMGFGEIARAYVIAKNGKLTVDQIFAMRKDHKGWGQIIKAAGLKAKDIGGLGKLKGNGNKNNK
jgi:hypothetical protein